MMKNVKSYAKINISLNIKGKREDGYHELDSIMVPIELHDSMIITPLDRDDNFVTVDDFNDELNHYNLVSSAIQAFGEKYNFNNHFRVFIHKVIPMQAGLGGGSSNAAFALKAVNQMLKLNVSDEELIELATPLGADIPFFIKCKPSRCRGIGEKIEPIEIKNNYYVLIVKPKEGCSTKEVFKIADKNSYRQVNIESVLEALREGDDDKLARTMGNSLMDAAVSINKEIKEIIEYLRLAGQKLVLMSGSGSSVFALSTDKISLKRIERIIYQEDRWFVELTKVLK